MKLHLGCGNIYLDGYINVDIQPRKKVDTCTDLRKLPWPDASVDMIYSCAVIEHFGRHEWIGVLKEWCRTLKPGGLLRLSTSDFDAAVKRYAQQSDLNELLGLLIGGQKDEYDHHGMIFNFQVLSEGLKQAGFENIHRYRWQDTHIGKEGIDDYSQAYLPHMDKENGLLMMLNVEATKIMQVPQ